jgi:hypothetical protein
MMVDQSEYSPSTSMVERIRQCAGVDPEEFLQADIAGQRLWLVSHGRVAREYRMSTSRLGIGNRENSLQTPLGIHRIVEKIGAGAPPFRIFRDRIDTGIDWCDGMPADNLVLTRILRLSGLEPGLNSGPGIDTYDRYIYIHGTNKEALIGTPFSHGCICMRNNDVIALFDRVKEGTIVVIN